MYSFKEKKKHLEELSNKDAAEADLMLLKQAQPTHHSLRTFERNPGRYAQDILYALLDLRSRDDIRNHRREFLNKGQEELTTDAAQGEQLPNEGKVEEEEPLSDQKDPDELKAEEVPTVTDSNSSQQTDISLSPEEQNVAGNECNEEVEQLKEQLQEAEERAELAEEEKESLQEELESEQEAREQAEADLEEEKKKEPKKPAAKRTTSPKTKVPAKSKSTKSTPK